MNKILAVDGMMEPIATSRNTVISIKMSASPLLFTKLHSLHPHFRLEGLVDSLHFVIYCSFFL